MKFKLWYFLEMPMKHYKAGPFSSSDNPIQTFTPFDKKILQMPKNYQTLERVLAKSTKYNFNILVFEKSYSFPAGKSGFVKQIQAYLEQNKIPYEDHITSARIQVVEIR